MTDDLQTNTNEPIETAAEKFSIADIIDGEDEAPSDPEKSDGVKEETKESTKSGGDKKTSSSKQQDTSANDDSDTVSLSKAELAKREKAVEENKQWGAELSRKLKSFEAKLAKYVVDGVLTEEEVENLKKDIQHEQREQGEEAPLMKYVRAWDAEIENLRKYTDDPNLDKKVHAFQHFLHNSSPEEINEVMESFKEFEDDSVKLTKKMLAVAAKYNDEIFSELYEAGNLKNFKKKYVSDLESKQKEIDKLNKEVLRFKQEYEDYTPPATMKLPVGTTDKFPEETSKKDFFKGIP